MDSNLMLYSDANGWIRQNGTRTEWAGGEDTQNHLSVPKWVLVEGVPTDGDDAWIPPKWIVLQDISTAKLDIVTIEGIS